MNQAEKTAGPPYIVRRKDEKAVYGLSTSTIDRLIAEKLFPPRKRIGGCVGSIYSEGCAALKALADKSQEA